MQEPLIKQSGFSLLEVLISMVIISVGLLGLSGLQIAALKGTTNAHARNVASLLTMELSERMRANPLGVAGAFYDNNVICSTIEALCQGSRYCSPEETARYDVQQVMCGVRRYDGKTEGGVATLLPAGTLQISCTGGCGAVNAVHDVTIGWTESLLHQKDTNTNPDKSSKTLSITIPIIP